MKDLCIIAFGAAWMARVGNLLNYNELYMLVATAAMSAFRSVYIYVIYD